MRGALVANLHDLGLRRCYELLSDSISSPNSNWVFFLCRLVNSWLKKIRSWADLNHRSHVYETGALTPQPQDLNLNGRFGLTVGTIANPFTELMFCADCLLYSFYQEE